MFVVLEVRRDHILLVYCRHIISCCLIAEDKPNYVSNAGIAQSFMESWHSKLGMVGVDGYGSDVIEGLGGRMGFWEWM